MTILLFLLLLIAPASPAQDFEDVLPEGDYYHLQYFNYKTINELKVGKSHEASTLLYYLKKCNYPPVSPERFIREAEQVVFASFVRVDSIVEDIYTGEENTLFHEVNDLTAYDLQYKDEEQKMVARIDELLETVIFVKVNSLKDLLNAGFEAKNVNDLKKGAIVAHENGYGALSYLYFARPGTLIISTNKNILSKIDKVVQGLLPPFRGTKMQKLIKANIEKGSLSWQIRNDGIRVDGWRKYAVDNEKSESLLDELEKTKASFPSFTVKSHYFISKAFNEKRTCVFRSVDPAQKYYNKEKQKEIPRFSLVPFDEERSFVNVSSLLEAKKFDYELSSNKVYANRSISVKEYIADNKKLKKDRKKAFKELYKKPEVEK